MARRDTILTAALLLGLGVSCTSGDDGDDDTGTPTDAGQVDTGTETDAGDVDSGQPEDAGEVDGGIDLTRDPSCTQGSWVVIVDGVLQDEVGAGVEAKAQVCIRVAPSNNQICLRPADSAPSGEFSVVVVESARCMQSMVMRAVAPGTSYAASYCHVDVSADEPIVDIPDPVVLYDTVPAQTLPPAGQTDQPRTVVFEDGLELEVTPDDFFGDYSMLASKKVLANQPRPCFLPAGEAFDGVYALGPEEDISGDGFPVRIPNETNLAPGTVVDLYVLGGLFCQLPGAPEPIEEGRWEQYGTATVNATGDFIEGGRLPCVNWFGYKAQ